MTDSQKSPEETFVHQDDEIATPKSVEQENLEKKDQDVRVTIQEIIKSPRDIEDIASSGDTQRMIKLVGLYLQIRDNLADRLGYPRKDGRYFNPETGIDITDKIRDFYPDSLFARLIIDRINNFGLSEPKGSDKLKSYLETEMNSQD